VTEYLQDGICAPFALLEIGTLYKNVI
jgi:hypothetical protein